MKKINCYSTSIPITGRSVLTSHLLNELADSVSACSNEIVKAIITPISLSNDGWCQEFRIDVFFYEKETASKPKKYAILMETAYNCDQPFDWDKLAEHYTVIPNGISSCYAGPSKIAYLIIGEKK